MTPQTWEFECCQALSFRTVQSPFYLSRFSFCVIGGWRKSSRDVGLQVRKNKTTKLNAQTTPLQKILKDNLRSLLLETNPLIKMLGYLGCNQHVAYHGNLIPWRKDEAICATKPGERDRSGAIQLPVPTLSASFRRENPKELYWFSTGLQKAGLPWPQAHRALTAGGQWTMMRFVFLSLLFSWWEESVMVLVLPEHPTALS